MIPYFRCPVFGLQLYTEVLTDVQNHKQIISTPIFINAVGKNKEKEFQIMHSKRKNMKIYEFMFFTYKLLLIYA